LNEVEQNQPREATKMTVNYADPSYGLTDGQIQYLKSQEIVEQKVDPQKEIIEEWTNKLYSLVDGIPGAHRHYGTIEGTARENMKTIRVPGNLREKVYSAYMQKFTR